MTFLYPVLPLLHFFSYLDEFLDSNIQTVHEIGLQGILLAGTQSLYSYVKEER
jgi:hypothetical protein